MKEGALIKFLSIIMILMLLTMTFRTYSYAVDQNATGTITVSGLEPGANVSIYKLTDVHIASNGQPESTPYTWVDKIADWVHDYYPQYDSIEDFYNTVTDDSAEAQEFYDSLARAIRWNITDFSATQTEKAEGEPVYDPEILTNASVEFTNCEMGTYLILVENVYKVYSPAVVNLVPEFDNNTHNWVLTDAMKNVNVELKSNAPSITKTVTDETSTKDNYGTNDEIQFTIVADVPKFLKDLDNIFYIGDKFNNGTVNMNSIEIYGVIGDKSIKLDYQNEYIFASMGNIFTPLSLTYDDITNIDLDFNISFRYPEIANYEQVKVVYKASLIKDATPVLVNMGAEGNKNNAYLIYKNNPYGHSSWQIQESSTTVYTYGIEISKVDKDGGTLLPGAKFEVLNNEGDGAYFYCSEPGKYNFYSPYEVPMSIDTTNEDGYVTNVLEVDDQGKLYIYGLDAGTYKLQEIEAPDGYNLATEPITIEIVDNDLDGKLDGNKEDGTEIDPNGTGIYTITVENSKGFQLPVTGGIGTVVFAATGIVVVGLGMTLLMIVFKKNRAAK